MSNEAPLFAGYLAIRAGMSAKEKNKTHAEECVEYERRSLQRHVVQQQQKQQNEQRWQMQLAKDPKPP